VNYNVLKPAYSRRSVPSKPYHKPYTLILIQLLLSMELPARAILFLDA